MEKHRLKIKRGKEIVRLINDGALQTDVARKYKITRDRVRQIYARFSPTPYKNLLPARGLEKQEAKKEVLRKTIRFTCGICEDSVYLMSGDKLNFGSKYCSRCRTKNLSLIKIKCDGCPRMYFPSRVSIYLGVATHFHSKACYNNFRRIYKKTTWASRLKEYRYKNYNLKLRVRSMEVMIAKLREKLSGEPKEIIQKEIITKEPKVITKYIKVPNKRFGEGKCIKCGMRISGEYENLKSKNYPDLCYGCDGSKYEVEQRSLVKSGVVNSK